MVDDDKTPPRSRSGRQSKEANEERARPLGLARTLLVALIVAASVGLLTVLLLRLFSASAPHEPSNLYRLTTLAAEEICNVRSEAHRHGLLASGLLLRWSPSLRFEGRSVNARLMANVCQAQVHYQESS